MARNHQREEAEIRRVIRHRDYKINILEGKREIKASQLDYWNRVNSDPHRQRKLEKDLDKIDAKIARIYADSLRRIDVIRGLMDSSSSSESQYLVHYYDTNNGSNAPITRNRRFG